MNFSHTLKQNKDFLKVFRRGKYYVGKIMVIYILPNRTNQNRLGVTTVKNFGNSIARNRIRRLIKESYRSLETETERGFDIVFSARKQMGELPSYNEVRREMKYLIKRIDISSKRKTDDN